MGFDIQTDILYLEGVEAGMEKGMEKGLEQGLEEGMEKGALKKAIAGIQNMTIEKISADLIARFLELEIDFVKKIQKQLLKKDKIVKALKNSKLTVPEIAKKLKVHQLLVTIVKEDLEKK